MKKIIFIIEINRFYFIKIVILNKSLIIELLSFNKQQQL
jgi:hypothetical protein